MKIQAFGISDIGKKRQKNEDSFYVNEDNNLYIVADGMGGHAAGERASKYAVDIINQFIDLTKSGEDITWPFSFDENLNLTENRIKAAIHMAHKKILDATDKDYRLKGMATTVVASLIEGDKLYIGHVGDSRAYLLRNKKIIQLTTDHSWVNEQLKIGLISAQQAKNHPFKNVVTRALGGPQELEVDLISEHLKENDVILLCSDGLTTMLEDKEILEIILANEDDIKEAAKKLVDRANEKGGNDNITLILIKLMRE